MDIIRAEQDNLVQATARGCAGRRATVAATAAVLGGLWMIDSNYARMAALDEETTWVLSHFRPEPEFVEVTRTALDHVRHLHVPFQGPRAARSLVDAAPAAGGAARHDVRAAAVVLAATVEDLAATALGRCDSDEPLVAARPPGS